jgi:hypothetical protein
MKTLDELITQEERAAIRAPIEQARTLPRRTFIDRDFDITPGIFAGIEISFGG